MGLSNFGTVTDEVVQTVRKRFLTERIEGNEEYYVAEDIDQVRNSDWLIKRFVILAYKIEDDAIQKVNYP